MKYEQTRIGCVGSCEYYPRERERERERKLVLYRI